MSNIAMPARVVRVAQAALNDGGNALKGARILILGLAYKANVDDDRESPSYKLIQKFAALGATVAYHDPFVPDIPRTREHAEYAGRQSVPAITPDYDLLVLAPGRDVYKVFDFSGGGHAQLCAQETSQIPEGVKVPGRMGGET